MSGLYRIILPVLLAVLASGVAAREPAQSKQIRVYLDRQILVALEGEKKAYTFDVVTGKEGKETEAGNYKILKKQAKYVSKTYGAEMPYAMFFTADGKAIHGTLTPNARSYLRSYMTESVGSHGCVGLSDDAAKLLFKWASVGTPVVVIRGRGEE
jgi:lipoprotein-anchoring transpeptidase ErfK/SrfK